MKTFTTKMFSITSLTILFVSVWIFSGQAQSTSDRPGHVFNVTLKPRLTENEFYANLENQPREVPCQGNASGVIDSLVYSHMMQADVSKDMSCSVSWKCMEDNNRIPERLYHAACQPRTTAGASGRQCHGSGTSRGICRAVYSDIMVLRRTFLAGGGEAWRTVVERVATGCACMRRIRTW